MLLKSYGLDPMVTPCTGVRIETPSLTIIQEPLVVTPCTGVRIETPSQRC